MKSPKEVVFICKAASEECHNGKDIYSEQLEHLGFVTKTISVLDFTYKNLGVLTTKLSQPELYSGIVFTSPRCVRAVINATAGIDFYQNWKDLPTFAVGETTARLIKDNLKVNAEGSCSGNGVTLAPIILKYNLNKPLLLPCGNLKMDTLEKLLAQGGVATECVEVYETIPHPGLESALAAAIAEQEPAYIVYFSPSGVHNTYALLKQSVDIDNIKWVAIGPTTAAALESYSLPIHCSAAKPTPQSLAEAMAAAAS